MKKLAIYAGTFDPITFGHVDLIVRSSEIFSNVILAIAQDTPKNTLFTLEERVGMGKQVTCKIKNVKVMPFNGLLINFAKEMKCSVLIRGIRAYSDFEAEFQMALTNRQLAPSMETLFMMPKENHSYVSSGVVKQIARLGADIRKFVPGPVVLHLKKKFAEK